MGETANLDEKDVKMATSFPASRATSPASERSNHDYIKRPDSIPDDRNNNQSASDDSSLDNNGQKRNRRDSLSSANLHSDEEDKVEKEFSRHKFAKSNREKGGSKFKSSSAQPNITKLSPIKLQIAHTKDLGTKIKNKKEPLPMKLRALPRSFWQQPNQPAPFSPAPALPPLANISSQRYEDGQASQNATSGHSAVVSDANTELLFSLFNSVENVKRPTIQKRGRPKMQHGFGTGVRDDDPCLVPSGLLPSLAPSRPKPDNPKTLNYSQLLNELVIQL